MNRFEIAVRNHRQKYWKQFCAELENKDTQYFLFEAMGTLRLDRDAVNTLRALRVCDSGMYSGFIDAIGEAMDGYMVHRSDGTVYRYQLK